MKKILAVIFSAIMIISFSSCAGQGDNADPTQTPEPSSPAGDYRSLITFTRTGVKTDGQLYTGGDVTYPSALWQAPEYEYADDMNNPNAEGARGIFITSPVEYQGKLTKIAGYIGFPEGASAQNKVPGIVLVHGGGGTAVPDWVTYWNDLGYAAISIDTEGGEPLPTCFMYGTAHNERNRYSGDATYTAGPTNRGFGDGSEPLGDQWMYHATSSVILANSLLRSFDCVDADKVGITGISWGGIITTIVIAYDERFAFAMPVYGCIGLHGSDGGFGTIYNNNETMINRWDDVTSLNSATTPVLFVGSLIDNFFSIDAANKCLKAAPNGFMLQKKKLAHGQEYGALVGELPFFANAAVGLGNELVIFTEQPTASEPSFTLQIGTEAEVLNIKLYYTEDTRTKKDTSWETKNIPYEEGENSYTFTVPGAAKHYFVQITYNTNLEITSKMVSL